MEAWTTPALMAAMIGTLGFFLSRMISKRDVDEKESRKDIRHLEREVVTLQRDVDRASDMLDRGGQAFVENRNEHKEIMTRLAEFGDRCVNAVDCRDRHKASDRAMDNLTACVSSLDHKVAELDPRFEEQRKLLHKLITINGGETEI